MTSLSKPRCTSAEQPGRHHAYKCVVTSIAECLVENDVEQLVWIYDLPEKFKDQKYSPLKVLRLLHNDGKLSESNVDLLEQLLVDIKHHELARKFLDPFRKQYESILSTGIPCEDTQSENSDSFLLYTSASSLEGDTQITPQPSVSDNFQRAASQSPTSASVSSDSLDRLSQTSHPDIPWTHGSVYGIRNSDYSTTRNMRHNIMHSPTSDEGASNSSSYVKISQVADEESSESASEHSHQLHQRRTSQMKHSTSFQGERVVKRTPAFRNNRPHSTGYENYQNRNSSQGQPLNSFAGLRKSNYHAQSSSSCDELSCDNEDYSGFSDSEGSAHLHQPRSYTPEQRPGQQHQMVEATVTPLSPLSELEEPKPSPLLPARVKQHAKSLENLVSQSHIRHSSSSGNLSLNSLSVSTMQISKKPIFKGFWHRKLNPLQELEWKEKVEKIQKYFYKRKFMGQAITCPMQIDVDGKGYPNPKLTFRLIPYGVEEDEGKQVTLEVQVSVDLQKKPRFPSTTELEFQLKMISNESVLCPLRTVRENIRVSYFYVKGVISHQNLTAIDKRYEHVLMHIQAKVILPH